jgi:hypothetical protein
MADRYGRTYRYDRNSRHVGYTRFHVLPEQHSKQCRPSDRCICSHRPGSIEGLATRGALLEAVHNSGVSDEMTANMQAIIQLTPPDDYEQ